MAPDSSPRLDVLQRAREARENARKCQGRLSACLDQLNELSEAKDTRDQSRSGECLIASGWSKLLMQSNAMFQGHHQLVSEPKEPHYSEDGSYLSDEEVPLTPLVPLDPHDQMHLPTPVLPLDRPLSHIFTASSLRREMASTEVPLAPEPAPPRLGWRLFGVGAAADHSYQVDTHPTEILPLPTSPLTISAVDNLSNFTPPPSPPPLAPPSQAPSPFQFGIPLPSPPPLSESTRSPSGRLVPSMPTTAAAPSSNFLQFPPPRNTTASSMSPAEALASILSNAKSLSPSAASSPTAQFAAPAHGDMSLALVPSDKLELGLVTSTGSSLAPPSGSLVDMKSVSSYVVSSVANSFHERGIENLYPLSPVSKEHYMMSNPLFTSSNRASSSSEGMLKKIVDRIELQGNAKGDSTALSPSSTAIELLQVPSRPYESYQELTESSYDEQSFESVGEEDILPLPSPSRDPRGQRRPRPVTGGGGSSLGGAASPTIKQQKVRDRRTTVERAVQANLSFSSSILSTPPPQPPAPVPPTHTPAPTPPKPAPTVQSSSYGHGTTAHDFFVRSSPMRSEYGSVDAPKKLASDFFKGVSPATQPPAAIDLSGIIRESASTIVTTSKTAIPKLPKSEISPPVPRSTLSPTGKGKISSPGIKPQEDQVGADVDPPPVWSPPREARGTASPLEPSSFTAALEEAEGGEDTLSQAWNSLVKGHGEGKVPDALKILLDQMSVKQPPPQGPLPVHNLANEKTKAELLASRSPAMVSLGNALEAVLRPRILAARRPRIDEADVTREVFRGWRMMSPSGRRLHSSIKAKEEIQSVAVLDDVKLKVPEQSAPPGSLLSSLLKSGLLSPNDTDFSPASAGASKRKGSARKRGGLMLSSILSGSPVIHRPPSAVVSSGVTNIKPPSKVGEGPNKSTPPLVDLRFYGLGASL